MKKTVKLLIITILLLLLLPVTVKADSFNLNVTANKTSLKPGDTVEINLNLSNINAGELGINTLEAVLEYDSNVFEEVTQSSFSSLNNWSITYNNEDTENKGKFLAVIVVAGVKENQDIGKITLKVKNGVKDTNTTVKIKNITSNNGQELIKENDKQVTFKVGTPQQNTNNTQTNTPVINTGNTSSGITVQNENLSPSKLPQTGIGNYIFFICFGILIIVAAIGYGRYRKMNSNK